MICKKCKEPKDATNDFYKKDKTCKECRKKIIRKRHQQKSSDSLWLEKERARHREKYERLGYKEKQKIWDEKRPWKQTSAYKNLHRDLKIPKGIAAHHWCYNDDKLKDIVLMDYNQHKSLHQLIELDYDKRVFKVNNTGFLLDSKIKHLEFILTSGFNFAYYNKDVVYTIEELLE